jgi:acyl dehydratase
MTALRTVAVGARREVVVVEDLTRTQIVQYAGASGDFNPIHTDERYAVEVAGYPSVFAHGMLTMGLTGQAVTALAGAENLLRFGVRFTAQVWPGDTLTVRATVAAITDEDDGPIAEFSLSTANAEGKEVMSGYAHARLAR